jgi:hypothetical protein
MGAALRRHAQARIEEIHEPGLAAAHAAPEIDAARRAIAVVARQAPQQAFAERRRGRGQELGAQALQVAQRIDLRRIRGEPALGGLARVQRPEHVVR